MPTIAIHTSKGGVGKTTLTTNLAFELASRGNQVLVIDLDEQANSSLCLGVNKADEIDKVETLEAFEQIMKSFENRLEVIDFMTDSRSNSNFDYKQYIYASNWNTYLVNLKAEEGEPLLQTGCIDVLPSSYKTVPERLGQELNALKALNRGLKHVKATYDYILIDTTPMFNLITKNALLAAQYILIPSQMEYLSAYGIRQPVRIANEIAEDTKGEYGNVLGIVPAMTDKNSRNNKAIKSLVQKNFKGIPLLQEISRATAIGQAQHKRIPLSIHAEQGKNQGTTAAKQIATLTQQIIKRINELSS